MSRQIASTLSSLALLIAAIAIPSAADAADPKANEIAQSMMKAMGGLENWNRAHFVRFDFRVSDKDKVAVDRAHLWDKMTGRYRLEGKTKDGKPAVTLFNAATREGTAYVEGKKLEGAAAEQALKDAYGAFINDMYWLAMPWKWMDSGVNLKYLGKKNHGGASYDVVQLTFGKVGLTPGDRYEAYVSPQSHLMEYWEYSLQSGRKGSATWEYATTGGIKLASNHVGDGRSINMGDVKVMDSADEALFTDPAKKLR
jgi:hypothetical protein